MGDRFQLTVAEERASLPSIRAFIDEACLGAKVGDEVCYDIKLAVDEACANIIEHGGGGEEPGSIRLSLQYDSKQVVVEVTDFGRSFEPSKPATPSAEASLESGQLGGFGLYFIYRSMDVVTYESNAAGNTLKMIKRLEK